MLMRRQLRLQLYPGVWRGDVRHVGVGGEIEAGGAPGQVLQALQQQVLNLGTRGRY